MSEEGTQYMVVDNGGKYIDVIYIFIYSIDIAYNTVYIASPLLIFPMDNTIPWAPTFYVLVFDQI